MRSQGVEARFVGGQGPFDALPELIAGRADVALVDVPTIARAAERHVDVIGVFQLYRADPSIVFALARSAIGTPEQLRGRKVGVRSPQIAAVQALRATLGSAGLDLSAVELVADRDLRALLGGGRVAAVAGPIHLAAWLKAQGQSVTFLPRAGWEIVPGPVVATTRAFVAGHPLAVGQLVGALARALTLVLADPTGLRDRAQLELPELASQPLALRAQVDAMLVSLANVDPDHGPGWADPERYAAAGHYLRELGTTEGTVELPKLVVNDFLPKPDGSPPR